MDSTPIHVVRWISYDESCEKDYPVSIGGLGGWFGLKERHVWEDYLEVWQPHVLPYIWALREEIVRHGLREGGDWHQYDPEGVPVFNDGTVASFSYRGWADLMAAIWESVDHLPYNYMCFYMSPGTTKEELLEDMKERPHIYHQPQEEEDA